MRTLFACAALALVACQASATVKRQSPIANLQSQRVVRVRVGAAAEGSRWTSQLEAAVVDKVAGTCRFDYVVPAAQQLDSDPDLIVDLNIQRSFRGGTGLLQNPNKAVMDVLLVLSDGRTDDLLGSAWIRGESPTVHVSGSSPEGKAIAVVAQSVAKLLRLSGCAEARVEPAPEPEPEPPPDTSDEQAELIARAEALNDEGKQLFRSADMQGAASKFQAAIDLVPDPRYYFNLCFSYEALKRYDDALATCREVFEREPSDRLRDKTNQRIQAIEVKKAGN